MPLNSSGPISLAGTTVGQSIQIENGGNGSTQISLNDSAVRTLAGVPSGAITMPTNFYGKSNRVSISTTLTSSTANASLNISSISGYSSGKSDITITVNGGVYLYSTATGVYGLNLTGGASGDTVTLVNNGFIAGKGGNGENGAGGPALNIGIAVNITINNTNGSAYIGGGGGAGNRGNYYSCYGGGGGAGGGNGSNNTYNEALGGAGGGPGSTGANGTATFLGCGQQNGGGGGGRIFPGAGGQGAGGGGGAGGASGGSCLYFGALYGGSANNGSSWNYYAGSGGGGWGAAAGNGGAGGKAINLNGNTVTFTSGNTSRIYGAVS